MLFRIKLGSIYVSEEDAHKFRELGFKVAETPNISKGGGYKHYKDKDRIHGLYVSNSGSYSDNITDLPMVKLETIEEIEAFTITYSNMKKCVIDWEALTLELWYMSPIELVDAA